LILSDDQGYGEIRSHGNEKIDTPVLDALAEEGARFDRFFVSPVCAPTRAALMTGRYHLRTGVVEVTPDHLATMQVHSENPAVGGFPSDANRNQHRHWSGVAPIVESSMTTDTIHPALRLSLLIALTMLFVAGELTAHPHQPAPPSTRRPGQNRIPMRITRPPRVAPDNQTEPLEVGSVPEIDAAEQVTLLVTVVDQETAKLLPHRVHVDDADHSHSGLHGR
jgi:hypothetical protein